VLEEAGLQPAEPPGIDPNLPQPGAPAQGVQMQPLWNRKTGTVVNPGGAPTGGGGPPGGGTPGSNGGSGNTHPMTPPPPPKPPSPTLGAQQGIQTQRPDGVR